MLQNPYIFMAIDQAKYTNFFNNHHNNYYNNYPFSNVNVTPQMATNESYVPMYVPNDVVHHQTGKVVVTPPAVKADSGITFNNSLVIPTSRKRSRDQISPVQLQTLPINPNPTTIRSTGSGSGIINGVEKDINGNGFGFLGHDLSFNIMQQQLELDRLLSHHMQNMKTEIEQRTKNQLTTIMAKLEESTNRKLREKQEELSKIGRNNSALEEKVKSLYIDNQIWREIAQTNETAANQLRANLEQLLTTTDQCRPQSRADDAGSCCGSTGGDDVDDEGESKKSKVAAVGETGWIYRGKNGGKGRLCRKCGEGESRVLILPCRHLCVCVGCGPAVNSCPVCFTIKNASVTVNLS